MPVMDLEREIVIINDMSLYKFAKVQKSSRTDYVAVLVNTTHLRASSER